MNYLRIKQIISLFFLIGLTVVYGQQIEIPDVNFEQALIDLNLDGDGVVNGMISESNAAKIKELVIPSKDISSLEGIQFFSNLEELYCNNNSLTSIDVSNNQNLRILNCSNNIIQNLDFTSNDNLEILLAENNDLQSLNLKNENRNAIDASFITSSVYGIVKDKDEIPVIGALVTYAGNVTTTNAFGFYSFENVDVLENGMPLAVHVGEANNNFDRVREYFKRTVMFSPVQEKSLEVNIKLAEKVEVGFIDAQSGGVATIMDGQTISFPENSVVDVNGEIYTGEFSVFAHYIDPESEDFFEELPGFLTGIPEGQNTDEEAVLFSFGMFQVEIETLDGSPLSIAPGTTVTLSTKLSDTLLSQAPETIDMWVLDESTGIWQQEGESILEGDTYVAEVSHFSTWNWDYAPCDFPGTVKIFGTVISESAVRNIALQGVKVYAELVDCEGYTRGPVTTDSSGFFQARVPIGQRIALSFVLPENECSSGGTVTSFTTGPFAAPSNDLGRISLALPPGYVVGEVTMQFVDENNEIIEDAAVRVLRSRVGERSASIIRAISGRASIASADCEDDSVTQIVAYDLSNADSVKSTDPITLEFINGEIVDLGNIVIGNEISDSGAGLGSVEFIKFKMDGVPYEIRGVFLEDTTLNFSVLGSIRGFMFNENEENSVFRLSLNAVPEEPAIFTGLIEMLNPAIKNTNGQFFEGQIGGIEFSSTNQIAEDYVPNAVSEVSWSNSLPESKYNYDDICDSSSEFPDSSDYFLLQGNFTMEATDVNGVNHIFTEGSIQIVFDRESDYGCF